MSPSRFVRSFYALSVNADIWLGAVTTLAGAGLGGAISFLLSRQQIRDSRSQRAEAILEDRKRRSLERRFSAYADFITHARRYRSAIRPYRADSAPRLPVPEIDTLAASADAAGSLVLLVTESPATARACRNLLGIMGTTIGVIHEFESDLDDAPWPEMNEDVRRALRAFQAAARAELEVGSAESVGL
jgi:hypothetical protein